MKTIIFTAHKFYKSNRSTWPRNNQKIIYIGQNENDLYKTVYYYQKTNIEMITQYFYSDNSLNEYSYSEEKEYEVFNYGIYSLNVGFFKSKIVFKDGDFWIDWKEVFS